GTVDRFRRNRAKPGVSSGHRSRLNDEDSVRGPHQGQQSTRTAPTGRTHDCKRPLRCTPNDLLPGGGHPHMRRREFITLLGGAAAAGPVAAGAEQGHVRRIGVLMAYAENDREYQGNLAAFREELQKLGWTEGRNVQIDYRWAAADPELMRRFARELIALQPDVILSSSSPTTASLLQETRNIPIIFANIVDPVGSGLVASLSRPGGNATGFMLFEASLAGKGLELLKEIAPRVSSVAAMFNPATAPRGGAYYLASVEAAAQSFGVEAIASPIHVKSDLEAVIAT